MSEILVDTAAFEDWICQQDQNEIVRWINQNEQGKVQKYLSYAWNHPSERIKLHMTNLLDKINNPINTLCTKGDPSNGELLRLFLNFMDSIDQDYFEDQQPFLMLAATYEKLTTEQLRMILTHPKTASPFCEKGCPYKMQPESAIEISIKNNNLDYFKEMIKHDVQMDKALSLACSHSLKILQYLIEEEGLSVNEIVCGKTPLQHSLNCHGEKKKPTADYLISHGADVTQKDEQGNLAFFYGCIYGYENLDKLIVPSIDMWATTKGIRVGYSDITDGMGLFGVASQFHQYEVLRQLLELKSALPQDPDLDRFVVADVMLYGDYIALWMIWPYVTTGDIIDFLTTQRTYGWDQTTPIEKLFREYSEIQAERNRHKTRSLFSMQQEANIRAIWKHLLMKLSRKEIDALLNTEIPNEGAIRSFIDSQYLLPDEYRFSYNLWRSDLEYDLGMLSNLPREIVSSIFSYLSVSDTCRIISVSKSWFKEITAKQIWISHPRADPNCSNPFRSIQKFQTDYYTDTRKSGECFRQIVRVDDGEGLLVLESGFLTGLKLNGEPIISSWAGCERSVYRCMVRSRSLPQESIETALHHIETMLNTGRIDFSSLVDTLTPFMKCLPSGFYDVQVFVRGMYRLFEYKSDSDLSTVHKGNISYPIVYFTQPSDLLNEERIKFYEDQIQKGLRPAALAITVHEEQIIIDGHHKILAYKNLGLLNELGIVGISYNSGEISRHQITVEAKMKYVSHSKAVQDRYDDSEKSNE